MLNKKQVLSIIKGMPDKFDIIQLFERIQLLNKIQEGYQQIQERKIFTAEEARKAEKAAEIILSF